MADALAMMAEYKIGGIPVVDEGGYLVGIVTNRDLRFEKDMNRSIDEVMTKENLVVTGQSTDMEAAAQILQEHKIEKLPVVDSHNKLIGLITYKDITKAKDKPKACKDSKGRLRSCRCRRYVQYLRACSRFGGCRGGCFGDRHGTWSLKRCGGCLETD